MYLNNQPAQPSPEEPSEEQRLAQLMQDLATELATRTGKPWSHAPGVGLCVDCGSMRIIFNPSGKLRDRERHTLELSIFNRLKDAQEKLEEPAWAPWPQVKLTKSAGAIANQLQRSEILDRLALARKNADMWEDMKRRDIAASTAGVEYIAKDYPWLQAHPAQLYTYAKAKGQCGNMSFEAESVFRQPGHVNLTAANIPLKVARKIAQLIELENIAQLIDQADDDADE